MQLSGLPAELFREVLYKLDPASFYACLQTSRLFREHALSSTDLLITHILRVPCPWTEASLRASPAQRLLRCFRRAAVKHLNHGCWMTDMHIWAAPSDIDRRNSLITQLEWNEYRGPRYEKVFVQVQRDAATIHIYYIGHHDAHCAAVCLKYIISPDLVSVSLPKKDGDLAQCQVLKVATMPSRVVGSNQAYASTPRIAVLYCGKCSPSELSPAWRRLLIFRLDEEFGPIVAEKCEVEIRKGERVVAMALNGDGEPIILYRKYAPYDWQFRLAVLRVDLDTESPRSECLSTNINSLKPLGGIFTLGTVVHICPASFPLPQWTAPCTDEIPEIERQDPYLPCATDTFRRPPSGRVIAHHHHHRVIDEQLADGAPTCVNTALQLEISQGKIFSTGFRVGAFLLKTVEYRSTCQTYNTDALHLSLDHVFVAELAGLPNLSDLSNIGLKIAVSPRSERIAIASWKTVKVWALDPLAFLDPEYSLDGDDGVPEDYAFLDGPGWRYYSCGDIQRDCVLLEPIELPSTGVVYDLGFRGENELWGCCERGLVRWNIGPNARQRREVNELP